MLSMHWAWELCAMFRYRSGSRLVEEAGGRLRVRTGVMEGGRTAVSILTIEGVRDGGHKYPKQQAHILAETWIENFPVWVSLIEL
jgi:hypothetical protein